MKRFLISIFLIALSVSAARAEDEDFNYDTEPSSEEPPVKNDFKDAHPNASACSEIEARSFKLRPADDDAGNLELDLVEKGQVLDRYEPYIDGPGNKCLKLKSFEKEDLILLEVCHGLTGTSVLVERHSLLVLRLEDKRIKELAEFEIKYVEREGNSTRVVNDKTYKTKRKDGKAVLVLKDKVTKKESEHFF